jgi:restriction system protein
VARRRKKNDGLMDGLVGIASAMPWWAGVALAGAAYVVLHHFALPPMESEAPGSAVDLANHAKVMLISTLCYLFQYLVPVALLLGAALSAWNGARAKKLLSSARKASEGVEHLKTVNWRDFETLVGQAFRERGFSVKDAGGAGPDGGIDLVLHQGRDKYLVQCKHWKAQAVGVAIVRELFGVMNAEGAVGGFVVASGDFTSEAKAFAKGRSIELVDARTLIVSTVRVPANEPRAMVGEAPAKGCPKCGKPMIRRQAKTGQNAGNYFFGCSGYPTCRGILPIKGSD